MNTKGNPEDWLTVISLICYVINMLLNNLKGRKEVQLDWSVKFRKDTGGN